MEHNSIIQYDIGKIIDLLVRDNYLSPISGEFLKRQNDVLRVSQISIEALRENLKISLSSGRLTPRNIRDFNSLLSAIESVKEDHILNINFVDRNKNRSVYVDQSLTMIFDEL